MAKAVPILFLCRDGVMVPHRRALEQFHAQFDDGEQYLLAESDDRSDRSHNHYFACLQAAFDNLPESLKATIYSREILRQHALIMTRFADVDVRVYASPKEAHSAAVKER